MTKSVLRLAILYDGETLAAWQKRAVDLVAPDHEIYHLVADNVRPPIRRPLRHGLYYALNLVSIRNPHTRRLSYRETPEPGRSHRFVPQYQGQWATLPSETKQWLAEKRIDAVIKFGLGLLQVVPESPPILSWHHGDPERFRGRPAGFYEMDQGEPFIGQMVQLITNRLDAGEVLAFAQTRVLPHSYRATLMGAYSLSPLLLPQALDALQSGDRVDKPTTGPNYRLPSNLRVIRAMVRMSGVVLKRLIYGAFFEKRWSVSMATTPESSDSIARIAHLENLVATKASLPKPNGYTFLADPFFGTAQGEVFAEGLEARSGLGRIVRICDGQAKALQSRSNFHLSYPATFSEQGEQYLIPEMARGGSQMVFRATESELVPVELLDIDAGPLTDPTLCRHEGRVYLFANLASEGGAVLRLWTADHLFGRFEEHPTSPIRLSSRGSRMAGAITRHEGATIRYGQDARTGYGDGILAFRIDRLTPETYRESVLGDVAFNSVKGPHTVNFDGDRVVFDWYREHFSLAAGLRRVRSHIQPRKR